ncbi:HAMP domain-containing protein [Lachnotalea glycerini]|uniref:histidine kinase n=1 Tax=Lachnotalea glycerini TaxID=1763509 RepID=A0A318EMR0_9FIRM|nr:HAMP domain-containing sensor histidine kinase [Lachnotalea glycerini]PXV85603.1 HAMP domain-containing protein [Lachnotalea glycerini]
MRWSLKKEIASVFIILMTSTIFLCWFVNNTFLERYYVANKENVLLNAYNEINQAGNDGTLMSDDFLMQFEKITSTGNISILVIAPSGKVIMSSVYDYDMLNQQLLKNIFEQNTDDVTVLSKEQNYIIQKTRDPQINTDYLEIWGNLENNNLFIMRTAVESIRESVSISNRFLSYVGLCAVMISAMIIWTVSEQISKPILDLARISKRMTKLDFEAKYTRGGSDEIAILGNHINKLSETLEKTISELKTANNELKTDIEKKEQIDEMRKEFLSNVSHELKTPIALVQGYAEGLKECINDDAESREFYCDVIMDEANKMNKMVQKLLTLNQIEFGNDKIALERFDITALIHGIIQASDILIKQKDVKVIFTVKEPIYVWADEFKLEEVFTNYFSNALNHVANEKIIDVKITKYENNIRVSVFNTGDRIPENDLDNIWIKFYKVDKARTREYGGSGIGLSIVKAIMDSLNKKCGVSNYDNGVEFWFELDSNVPQNN